MSGLAKSSYNFSWCLKKLILLYLWYVGKGLVENVAWGRGLAENVRIPSYEYMGRGSKIAQKTVI